MESGCEFKSDDSLSQSDVTSKIEETASDFEDLEELEDVSDDVVDNAGAQTENSWEIVEDDCSNLDDYVVVIDDKRASVQEFIESNGNNETTEMIQHRELDDALLAAQIHYAEGLKSVGDKLQSGDCDVCDPLAISRELDNLENKYKKDENEIYSFRHVNKWSTQDYTEEYIPDSDE